MKYTDLENMLSDKVYELMQQGWRLCSSNASFGGINASIALRKGGEYRVVYLTMTRNEKGADGHYNWAVEACKLAVAEGRMEWNFVDFDDDDAKDIESAKFYSHTRCIDCEKWYVETEEEAMALFDKMDKRHEARRIKRDAPQVIECTDALLDIIRKRKGFKSVKKEDIVIVKEGRNYGIGKRGTHRNDYCVGLRRA